MPCLVNLFDQLAGENSGGTWTDLSTSGVDLSDPTSVDFSPVNNGTYQFQYEVSLPGCGSDSAIVPVHVSKGPTPVAPIIACEGDPITGQFNIYTLLGITQDPNATYTIIPSTGITVAPNGDVDLTSLTAPFTGNIFFSVSAVNSISTAGCPDCETSITVEIIDEVSSGLDGFDVVCNSETC